MSATPSSERWLTFEVAGSAYALPIADVLEVADVAPVAAVPTLPRRVGGVMHYHGDALVILGRDALFDVGDEELAAPQHVVVVAGDAEETARLGLPVDRVLGMAAGERPVGRQPGVVMARRPIEGRIVGLVDTERLVERAGEVISRAGRSWEFNGDPEYGGES